MQKVVDYCSRYQTEAMVFFQNCISSSSMQNDERSRRSMEAAEFTVVTMILLFFERIILTPGVDFRSTSVAYFYLRRPCIKEDRTCKDEMHIVF